MAAVPAHITKFYEHVKKIDLESLEKLPRYIKGVFSEDSPLFRCKWYGAPLYNYTDHQDAYLDFTKRCVLWPGCQELGGAPHYHGMRPGRMFEIQGFPGLYVYPALLRHGPTQNRLAEIILHEELSKPTNLTNLHENFHVKIDMAVTDGQRPSIFDPAASKLQFQPRLNETWTDFPLNVRQFVQKLRWLDFGMRPNGSEVSELPVDLKQFMDNILRISSDFHSATANISTVDEPMGIRQHSKDSPSCHVVIGCNAVIVVGGEPGSQGNDPFHSSVATAGPGQERGGSLSDDDWFQFVVGLDQNEDGQGQASDAKQSNYDVQQRLKDVKNTEFTHPVAAIRLRVGDILLFTGSSQRAWYGVAKVLEGTAKQWEENWPCRLNFETPANQARQNWKGCMRGRMIDLVVS